MIRPYGPMRPPGFISRLLGAPGALAGTVVLVAILALAVLAPLLAPYDWNYQSVSAPRPDVRGALVRV